MFVKQMMYFPLASYLLIYKSFIRCILLSNSCIRGFPKNGMCFDVSPWFLLSRVPGISVAYGKKHICELFERYNVTIKKFNEIKN